jgi:hypothetical protein
MAAYTKRTFVPTLLHLQSHDTTLLHCDIHPKHLKRSDKSSPHRHCRHTQQPEYRVHTLMA